MSDPEDTNETQMVLIPVAIEAVCVTIAIAGAIVLVALFSKPLPI